MIFYTPLNVAFVYSLTVDSNNKIYVGSLTNGVFVLSDEGATWSSLGMSGSDVCSIIASSSTKNILVGTKSGKVYSIADDQNVTDVEASTEIPTEFKLMRNYPNPFNLATTIEFAVLVAGKYSLKVYNILGQEVANLFDKEWNVGTHRVTFNASMIATGVYIYRFSGNNVSMTKKMLLMK